MSNPWIALIELAYQDDIAGMPWLIFILVVLGIIALVVYLVRAIR